MTSEADTRKQLIDEALRLAGWDLADPAQVIEEFEIDLVAAGAMPSLSADVATGPFTGKQFADYVLLVRGRVAAVVEAKRTAKDALCSVANSSSGQASRDARPPRRDRVRVGLHVNERAIEDRERRMSVSSGSSMMF